MYERIAQSVAQTAVVKVFSSADHLTPLTGATLTVQISKGGASFASPHSGAVMEIGSGWYSIALDTTDTSTLGPLIVKATATGADPAEVVFDVYNQYNMGIGALPGAALASSMACRRTSWRCTRTVCSKPALSESRQQLPTHSTHSAMPSSW